RREPGVGRVPVEREPADVDRERQVRSLHEQGGSRPDIDPTVAAGWLDNVAALFTARLGVQVAPEQVKSSAVKPPSRRPETPKSGPLPCR
ncbi:hypothetical protein ACRAWF_01365, partial [Streptomyces sp. L7]